MTISTLARQSKHRRTTGPQNHARFAPALHNLLRARELALDAECDVWEFAVEISRLIKTLDRTDLRWLIKKGYVAEGRETTGLEDSGRQFLNGNSLKFTKESCFVLTELGAQFVAALEEDAGRSTLLPRWDQYRHELWVGDQLIKQFRVPSANQETILSAFEEEGWPPKIDDPLSPHPSIDPKRRLHDTIKGLNRNQKAQCLRFQGDGTGEAVLWVLALYTVGNNGAPVRSRELKNGYLEPAM